MISRGGNWAGRSSNLGGGIRRLLESRGRISLRPGTRASWGRVISSARRGVPVRMVLRRGRVRGQWRRVGAADGRRAVGKEGREGLARRGGGGYL